MFTSLAAQPFSKSHTARERPYPYAFSNPYTTVYSSGTKRLTFLSLWKSDGLLSNLTLRPEKSRHNRYRKMVITGIPFSLPALHLKRSFPIWNSLINIAAKSKTSFSLFWLCGILDMAWISLLCDCFWQFNYTMQVGFVPFLSANVLNFQGSSHQMVWEVWVNYL